MSEYYQFRDETGTPIDYYQLVDDNNELCKEIESLQQRIDKAIEFIENNKDQAPNGEDVYLKICLLESDIDELLEILQGGEKDK